MKTPLVSIVTPAYNAEPFLARTLESMRAQTFPDWECVVVDDGSADRTAAVAEACAAQEPRIRVLRQPNSGAAAARNNGFRLTNPQAPFVTFMDSDDVWEPRALELLLVCLEAQPQAVGAHGVADMIDEHDRPHSPGVFADGYCRNRIGFDGKRIRQWDAASPTSFNILLLHGVYPPGLILTRREHVEAVGGFESEFWPMEDWQILLKLAQLGDFAFLDEIILRYRRHGANATGNEARTRHVSHLMRHWMHFCEYRTPAQKKLAQGLYRPYQAHRMQEKARVLAECLRGGSPARVPGLLVQWAGLACRYLRGYPVVGGPLSG